MSECLWCKYCSTSYHCHISACQWVGGFEVCPWPNKRNKIAAQSKGSGAAQRPTAKGTPRRKAAAAPV
jgi:hypothetical protein